MRQKEVQNRRKGQLGYGNDGSFIGRHKFRKASEDG
jgi:hypothetical protein